MLLEACPQRTTWSNQSNVTRCGMHHTWAEAWRTVTHFPSAMSPTSSVLEDAPAWILEWGRHGLRAGLTPTHHLPASQERENEPLNNWNVDFWITQFYLYCLCFSLFIFSLLFLFFSSSSSPSSSSSSSTLLASPCNSDSVSWLQMPPAFWCLLHGYLQARALPSQAHFYTRLYLLSLTCRKSSSLFPNCSFYKLSVLGQLHPSCSSGQRN